MEKTKIIRISQVVGIVLYLVLFIGLLVVQGVSLILALSFSVSSYIYWTIFLGWVFLVLRFRLGSSYSFLPAFALFLIVAALATFGLNTIAETIMRISFIGWLVGIGQALVEYRKEHDKKSS